jgi:hypothetical protein
MNNVNNHMHRSIAISLNIKARSIFFTNT